MIKECQPAIVMELCPYALEENGSSLEEMLDILYSENYHLELVDNGNSLFNDPDKMRKMFPEGSSVNIVARYRKDGSQL